VFKSFALIGAAAQCRMQAETVALGAQARWGSFAGARQAVQAQYLLSRAWAERLVCAACAVYHANWLN
jgi:hypothetical protein